MEFIPVEVNLQPYIFSTLKNPSSRIQIKDTLLAEHIYIVDMNLPVFDKLLQLREVVVDDVISSFYSSFSPGAGRARSREAS